ncbi:MAG: helical backbone metal receptor [Bacteroidia bacterium]|nr:helical backbone metal receptor [Bacteroidia bacterium]
MRSVIDSLGRRLQIPEYPQRIISLCPSQTETLFALGVGPQIVGRTRYCIEPKGQIEQVAVVGGTKKVDVPLIATLQPDLIIAQMEENTAADVERLSQLAPVYVTRVERYEEALESIQRLGDITQKQREAEQLIQEITFAFSQIPTASEPLRVLYLIWRKPYMAAGANTYIDSLLTRLGWQNEAASLPGRYPTLESDKHVAPELILLSDEPFPFSEKHIPEIQRIWPSAMVYCVKGDYFSWYGARMRKAAPYLRQLLENIAKERFFS